MRNQPVVGLLQLAGMIPYIVPVPVVIFAVWRRDFYDFHNHLSCHILQFLKKIHFLSHSVFLFIQNLFSIYSLSWGMYWLAITSKTSFCIVVRIALKSFLGSKYLKAINKRNIFGISLWSENLNSFWNLTSNGKSFLIRGYIWL